MGWSKVVGRTRRVGLLSFLLCGLICPVSRAEMWIVATDGTGDFSVLQEAVRAATDGDIILIRPGHYGRVAIRGKGLELVAQVATTVSTAPISIQDLAQDQHVTISGLSVWEIETGGASMAALEIVNCEGAVRLQDLSLGDAPGAQYHQGWGAYISQSSNVSFSECAIRADFAGETGMRCANSNVSLHSTSVTGGVGAPGGIGLFCEKSVVFLAGSIIKGGRGTDDHDLSGGCSPSPGDGGTGLVLERSSLAYRQASGLQGGNGGYGTGGLFCDMEGADGAPRIISPNSQLTEIGGPVRTWTCNNWSYRGGLASFEYSGAPGDVVSVLRSAVPEFAVNPSQKGIELLTSPGGEIALGIADLQGRLQVELPMEQVIPEGGSTGFFLQARVIDSFSAVNLSSPGHIALLDPDFSTGCTAPIFVDGLAPPGGDGTSWTQATNSLRDGLLMAQIRFEQCGMAPSIWVAEGVYGPEPGASINDPAFELTGPVKIYGGFAGWESHPDQREISAHPTILTGDHLGNDGPGFAGYADNSAWVLLAFIYEAATQNELRLDGLSITGARSEQGARVVFWGSGSRMNVESCSFYGNRADIAGGGLHASAEDLVVSGCRFSENSAGSRGGGAYLAGHDVSVVGCEFVSNESEGNGAGLATDTSDYLVLANCFFARNIGGSGGAIWIDPTLSATVSNCTILNNHSSHNCAGLSVYAVDALVNNCILWGNHSGNVVGEEAQITADSLTSMYVTRSCIQDWIGIAPGHGNFGIDPLLTPGGHLGPGSACIDAGVNRLVPRDELDLDGDGDISEGLPFDLSGHNRFVDHPTAVDSGIGPGPIVDLGAFETQNP